MSTFRDLGEVMNQLLDCVPDEVAEKALLKERFKEVITLIDRRVDSYTTPEARQATHLSAFAMIGGILCDVLGPADTLWKQKVKRVFAGQE